MKRKIYFALVLPLFYISVPLNADPLNDLLNLVQKDAFKVNITARVMEHNAVSVWNMTVSRLTISGKTVNVKLTSDKLIVIAQITPYVELDDSIILIAQGQVYLSTSDGKSVKYVSMVKSLPIVLGESVLFYPLGKTEDEECDYFTIEMEIQLLPYL